MSRLERASIVCQLGFVLFPVSGIAFVPFISITFLPAGTNCMDKTGAIHRNEQDGDWYIYLQCFAHENSKRAYKNTRKNCKSFKFDKSNAVSIGATLLNHVSTCPVGLVWFARYCGKKYSRHLFSYGGFYETLLRKSVAGCHSKHFE